jgi:hypothetical protein
LSFTHLICFSLYYQFQYLQIIVLPNQKAGERVGFSYDIIKAHGGKIKVETKEGGCSLRIELPILQSNLADMKNIVLLLLFVLTVRYTVAQQNDPDSLKQVLSK